MSPRRVVMVAMPCTELVDVVAVLDVLSNVNERVARAGTPDRGYALEVVGPVATIGAWPGLRLVSDRSYRSLRGPSTP